MIIWDGSNKLGVSLIIGAFLNRELISFVSMAEVWVSWFEMVSMLIAESSSNIMISSSSLLVFCCSIVIYYYIELNINIFLYQNFKNKNELLPWGLA